MPSNDSRAFTMGKSKILVAVVAICFAHFSLGVTSMVDRMYVPDPAIAPRGFLDKYDFKLRQFAKLFANSSTGRLLKEVVEDLAAYPAKKFGVDIDSAASMRQPVYYPPPQAPVVKGNLVAVSGAALQR
ncbi:putative transmembrane protein [Toxoplasma gondii RUB]|uniref:Uncharacterized protein n=12 Tax=Toxoplasma gondii TaxID=5811 RepID=A0A125YXN7_TOXGG|nr:hypothetical protein TGGT1_254680 [Toxoplasma gondii GT1]ESS30447.1 putative transmembrane protein [Toxoplasma gondii VEG]KAF4645260.1 hypothetical protein TGRH88_003640 [Toxoplasma gondii]KFG35384.1 putative transmembrane protein [Toxoplasma gondii GAB2-2007-GAL-DOM2]KFG46672.1 putative transmembrane protein [Toxoplasma gondii p89]KFG53057.1 putative transmembrane protein [Toxoplasma gondii FOU]KFG59919.1 putative transmembrane protein [Toxoplasma gondii RUB]KFH06760.1 putative transmemb